MHIAVYLPLVLPLAAAPSARWLAARLDPRVATGLLTVVALGLAAAGGIALTALAATAVGQIPLLGALGDWSVWVLRRDDPASLTLALVACVLLTAALATAGRTLVRRVRALADAARTARLLPLAGPRDQVVVLDDPTPDAYALPGAPGRIVVSTGMLDALDEREQRVLFAHERAHLACGHHLFVTLAYVAAATNPLLLPVAAAVRYSTERWADEHAARVVGDRRLVARTIAKAALLTRRGVPAAALGIATGLVGRLRGPGPVPRRVAALLATPPRQRRLLLAVTLGVLVLAALSSIEAARDLDALFELARAGTGPA
ncbi:M56 family metallopeptidase [Amycolatopsis alkalitolerans]|uniref:M56 family metallopeptidase n=1 Tax=Amycolatopsis alkalitolerans TaxID=2547244 RepID=A0A5C4LRL8_9PSEU|nr:M56 family metallopeptidase [Amycolatopsis alkalitolerans]TNC20065.1 M56 family metallopeptidase [Amycolatopsis alkalitolerans]